MRLLIRTYIVFSLSLGLASCGGLLGGGKPPANLFTLTPEAAEPPHIARTAAAGQSVTVEAPVVRRELGTVRVPVQVSPTVVQYVPNMQLVDTPAKLFGALLAETVRRTTGRVVLDLGQTSLDPGLTVSGQLQRFGYDAATGQVIVTYDGALSTAGGKQVETRRFTATVPADGSAGTVGPGLNRAANQVALDVAKWIGG
jgi:cholesterol transport system auxiliary component